MPHLRASQRPTSDLYGTVGRAYAAAGDPVQAAAFLKACLAEIDASDPADDALFVRFSTLRSYALSDCGDIPADNGVLVRALERSESLDDPYTELRLNWSLGRLYATSGEAELAGHYLQRAITLCERTEDRFHLAAAHERLATALLDQNDTDDAFSHLDTAESICTELGETARVGLVRAERARHALLTANHADARDHALEALNLLEQGNAPADTSGDVWQPR